MTRCKKYWDKVLEIKHDKDAMAEFCQKNPETIKKIIDHAEYCERNFANTTGGTIEEYTGFRH